MRDGRPHGDTTPPAVCYFYRPDRKSERPREHLKDFRGVLHADAYSGYDQIYINKDDPKLKAPTEITEAACWAHTRRKFHEVVVTNDKASIATEVLNKIGEIYKIEAEIKGSDPSERLKRRQTESKLLVETLFVNFKKYQTQLAKKSTTAKAINYALNNQIALMCFLDDGKIELIIMPQKRRCDRLQSVVKIGSLPDQILVGHTAANIYSLIETAKLNHINPWTYLKQVLECIQDHSSNKLVELLPWNIKLIK